MDAPADAIDADLTAMANVVTRLDAATPAPMIDVISLRPNASVADVIKTDATGHAMIHIYPGGTVTAVFHHMSATDAGADLATVTGVQPNDTLTLEPPHGLGVSTSGAVVGSMQASWPVMAGTVYYYLYTPCGGYYAGAATLVSFTEYAGCHKTPMTLAYVAFGSSGILAFETQTNVSFVSGGSTGISTWATPTNVTVNAPAFPPEIQYYQTYVTQVINSNYGFQAYAYNGTPGMPFNHVYAMANGERMVAELQMSRRGVNSSQTVWDTINGNSWPLAAPNPMPWMTAAAFSAADRSIAWFADGTPTFDGVGASISWQRQIVGPPAMTNTYTWIMAIAPGEWHVELPQLPAPFADMLPTLDDQPTGQALKMIDFATVNDYNAFRQLPSSSFLCPECRVFDGTFAHLTTSP
jgi:hypothetical protein